MREILYGRQPVREVLRAGRRQVYRLLLAEGVKETGIVREVLALWDATRVPVQRVDRRELDKLGGEANHQGLAVEVSGYPYVELADLEEPSDLAGPEPQSADPLFLLLDHLRDPQNLGSLLRSAEAVGVRGVVLPHRRAAPVTPAAVRASAGASEHLRIARVTNLVRAIETLKASGIWLAGLDAGRGAEPYAGADLSGPLGIVVGGEGAGLSRLVREHCDFLIRLPMHGRVESLNAAVAGSVALYEARRQRGAPP
jgi:23S rRNA (guanosine2251-2'-O)-methyltransferase